MGSHYAILPIEFNQSNKIRKIVSAIEGMLCCIIDWRNLNTGEMIHILSLLSYVSGSSFKLLSMLRIRRILAQWLSGEKDKNIRKSERCTGCKKDVEDGAQ
jgi:hypothetical protein